MKNVTLGLAAFTLALAVIVLAARFFYLLEHQCGY